MSDTILLKETSMKIKSFSLLLTLFSLLLLSSCNFFGPSTTTHRVTLASGESYDINLGISGDEHGAMVTTRPLHAAHSQTMRDTLNYEVHFLYTPNSSYIGEDYVKVGIHTIDTMSGWDCIIDDTYFDSYIEFIFTIAEL